MYEHDNKDYTKTCLLSNSERSEGDGIDTTYLGILLKIQRKVKTLKHFL